LLYLAELEPRSEYLAATMLYPSEMERLIEKGLTTPKIDIHLEQLTVLDEANSQSGILEEE
jgi:hypothetical protein